VQPMRVAIVGGGPGGLMTAYLLERRTPSPCAITLFEASHRLGGKIVTRQFSKAPVLYEAGAAELYDYSQLGPDPLREMIAEFGLTTRPMSGETVVLGGRILKTESDTRRAYGEETFQALKQFRRKARSLISPAEYYESDWQEDNRDPLSTQRFDALLAEVGDATARRYIETAIHSDVATEPEQTNSTYGLQNYLMNEPDYMRLYTIDGGIERLPQELARRITARVLLNQPVIRVEQTAGKHYRVTSRRGDCEVSDEFDFVVVALPNNWIPAIEWGGTLLDGAMRKHHDHYNHPAHYLRVSVLFQRPFWREQIAESYFMLDAFGGCCVYDESARNGGGGYGVLGWLLGGEAALTQANFDDATLIQRVLDSLPASLRHGRDLFLEGQVHRWLGCVNGLPGGNPQHDLDTRHQPEPAQHEGLFVVGDYIYDSTLNGVLDSADYVTDWIVEELKAHHAKTNDLAAVANTVSRNGSAKTEMLAS
jgi:monoamine oxidase